MSKISEILEKLYKCIGAGEPRRPIAPQYVNEAVDVLQSFKVNDAKGLFYYMSAINLLNAAIKMKEYKKKLSYGFIKGKAVDIMEFIANRHNIENVRYYFNATENCLYVTVFDVVFSFHQVAKTDFILNVAAKAEPIVWPGIRLQWIAEELYLLAKEQIGL